MKKLIIFGVVIVALFAATAVLTNMAQTKNVSEDNPYGKTNLDTATADLLDDPHYQNIITPDQLDEKLEAGEDVTVYFFSPTCQYCQEATPRLMPLAEEMGVDVQQYNVLEFEEGWNDYNIEATPTLVHFEDGEEVARLKGAAPDHQFEAFFNENVLD